MQKFQFALSGFLMAVAINLTYAANENLDLKVIEDFVAALERQRRVTLCMTRTCDPQAIEKLLYVDDVFESELQTKPMYAENLETDTFKLDKAMKKTAARMLALEPQCADTNYSCPHRMFIPIPKSLQDYIEAIGDIVKYSKCVNLNNVDKAVEALGKSVMYVESYHTLAGNYFERILPAPLIVVKGFKELC